MLYVVSTPIGNLKDITYRAVETLKSVDLIAAEDTRHTRILTRHYHIDTPLTSYFEHNENKKAGDLLKLLRQGKSIALVSDAGTPGISDPGYRLIHLAREHHIKVTVIPGACALIAALTASGFSSSCFVFEGFLPTKTAGRKKKLETLLTIRKTLIFYESPYRIIKMLQDVRDVFHDPFVACVRELTKKFEEIRHGYASEHIQHFHLRKPKGEFVVIVEPHKR